MEESEGSTDYKYFLKRFERDIQIIFDEVFQSILSHKVNILKANKNLKCDYFIPLQSSELLKQNIDVIVKKLQSISYISNAGMDSNFYLTLKLKRNMVFEAVLGEISMDSDRYGYLNKNKSVLVLVNFLRSKSLENKRNSLLAEHVVTVLANNGMKVFHNDFQTKKFFDHSHISRLTCTDKCSLSLDTVSKELDEKLKISEYKCELEDKKMSINLKEFITKNNLLATYGNSLASIVLPYNSISESLKNTCFIMHLVKHHIQYSPDVVIHIGSQGQNKGILQGGVISNMLGCNSSQVYIFSHSVNYKSIVETDTYSQFKNSDLVLSLTKCSIEPNFKNDMVRTIQESDSLAEQFAKAYHQVIENSTAMKYESYDPSHESWSSRIQSLTDAAVKFDFLSQSYLINLVLLPPSERGSPKTSGVFIQYNHARLSNLFRNFDAMVADGTYTPLCSLDSADLTVLSHDVEWDLLNILASFPQMVEEVVDSLLGKSSKGRIQTGRIPGTLRGLCRLLSLYYGKVRVLCGPQMQRHVHARMWLMKGVHQVLHNGLLLMNIQGLDLM